MEHRHVIFVSAVSSEFHRCPPDQRHIFRSYRDVLKDAFRMLARHYEVIVQENLVQGADDLLETLEHEIARSLLVIHLVGDLAGERPQPASLRRLHERHRDDFLASEPELRAALGDEADISYTQWEAYLAFQHQKKSLVFEAGANAVRSPGYVPDENERDLQQQHRQRLHITGAHRGSFRTQADIARRAMRSFLHLGLDTSADPAQPEQEARDEAWRHQQQIVQEVAAAIKKPDLRAVPVLDPANVASFVAAVRAAAEKWQLSLKDIVTIVIDYEQNLAAINRDQPTAATLREEAFATYALGDYSAAQDLAAYAASLARQQMKDEPQNEEAHRQTAINAHLLEHDAAKANNDRSSAIAALEHAGQLVDKEKEPLLWAEVHEPLAEFLLEQAHYDEADDLISDLIDIREEHQGENHPDLAKILLLWGSLLYSRANFTAVGSVVARAERIFASQTPPDVAGVASALNSRAVALRQENRLSEAESLYRQALAISEKVFGIDHPSVAAVLGNLGWVLEAANHLAEAEALYRRALQIDEQSFGLEHPRVAKDLNNLGLLLKATNRPSEAESLMRRMLAIYELSYGYEHPYLAIGLSSLALLLRDTNRPLEAEPLMRRALSITEHSHGSRHPEVANRLHNLALLLKDTNRLAEAEPLIRRALEIDEETFGPVHPTVANNLNNLASLLQVTNRLAEAELLYRRALEIDEHSFGFEHPNVAHDINNLATLLWSTDRLTEAAPLMRRAAVILAKFTATTGHEHPHLQTACGNYHHLLVQSGQTAEEARERLRSALAEGGLKLQD